jgi:hypothetical protein
LLTSAQVQTFLQDQSVQVHASAAARTSALGTAVSAGMVSYRADDKALELYAGSAWQPVMQNRNVVINGGFDFFQRSTSASANPGIDAYVGPDRWKMFNGASGSSVTVSQQAFSPGNTIPGYEPASHLRVAVSGFTSGNFDITNRIEDVRTFAGQTATLSFWAKADASRTLNVYLEQGFGSGGSALAYPMAVSASLTTSWQRFSFTVTVTSISGKTVGAGSFLAAIFRLTSNATFDLWGVQLEAGSVATPFVRAGGTLQGELAACLRYYQRFTGTWQASGAAGDATNVYASYPLVAMRTTPTAIDYSGVTVGDLNNTNLTTSSVVINQASPQFAFLRFAVTGATQYRPYFVSGSGGGYIGISAEL